MDLFEEIRWEVENIDSPSPETEQILWLTTIGDYFVNHLPSSSNNGDVIRALGTRFLNTRLQKVESFLKVPYHNSIKIGDGESGEIEYRDTTIYCASSVKKPKLAQYKRLFSELTIETELKELLILLIERDDACIFEECDGYFRVSTESDEDSTSVPQQLSHSEKRSANHNEFERNIKNAGENESSPSTPVQHQTGTTSSVSTMEMPNQSQECVSNVPKSSNYNLSNLGYESRDKTGGTHRQKNHSVGEAIRKKTVGSKSHYPGMATKYDEDDAPARAPLIKKNTSKM